jgi:Protein of unknown function (DUF3616)
MVETLRARRHPERQRLFATNVKIEGDKIAVSHTGKPYNQLLDDLIAEPRLAAYGLGKAAGLAPKSPGALNIEGLAATPERHLLIGFRNPIPGGKALIVPLLNPTEVVDGARAKFGEPIEIDLGGLGIRSLGYHEGRYVIIAGAFAAGGGSKLFEWNGKDQPRLIEKVVFTSLNPEGFAFHRTDGTSEYFVLSDDGSVMIEDCECKKLKEPAKKRFRGRAVRL